VNHKLLSFSDVAVAIPNIGKIDSKFGISELRENFLERDCGGRDLAGNYGHLEGSRGASLKIPKIDLQCY
jgi:hypothetical protein